MIAVASRDGETVAGHIGKCADWIVFEAADHVREVERVHLPKELIFHHYNDGAGKEGSHPLDGCSVVIGASAGESFAGKMERRGIKVALTAESDPQTAVADFLKQTLSAPRARPVGGLVCKLIDKSRDAFSIMKGR